MKEKVKLPQLRAPIAPSGVGDPSSASLVIAIYKVGKWIIK
jgi:hypothetical protein